MEHFAEEAWIDYVRGIQTPSTKTTQTRHQDMKAHVKADCEECIAAFGLWKQVHNIAAKESCYAPPAELVRLATLELAARKRQDGVPATWATMIFDTLAQPMMAGVRSTAAAPRQMVYEADGLTIDLRFDRQPCTNQFQLVGQVMDSRRCQTVSSEFPVMLWTENGLPIAESKTNHCGEFQLAFEAQERLRLSIQVAHSKLIHIPLSAFVASAGSTQVTCSELQG